MKTKISILALLALCLISFLPVIVPKAVWIGGTNAYDTTRVKGHFRADSTVRLTKYQTSDTNKVLGISSTGYITMRTKGGGVDSSIYSTRYWVGQNYVAKTFQLTTGWNGTVYSFNDNPVLISPTWDNALAQGATTNRIVQFGTGSLQLYCNPASAFQVRYSGNIITQFDQGYIKMLRSGNTQTVVPSTSLSGSYTFELPNKAGVAAVVSDLPAKGAATLSSGTVTVTDANVSVSSAITLTLKTATGTISYQYRAVPGSGSFVITGLNSLGATNAADNSTITYIIVY